MMTNLHGIKNGSVIVIVPSFGSREPIRATVSGINSDGVQPIVNYTFDGGKGWAFYSQIEKVIKQ